jgi:hypothetical protein
VGWQIIGIPEILRISRSLIQKGDPARGLVHLNPGENSRALTGASNQHINKVSTYAIL